MHWKVFPGFSLADKQIKQYSVLGKASEPPVSVFGTVGCSRECLERAELSSLPSVKASENPPGAIAGT